MTTAEKIEAIQEFIADAEDAIEDYTAHGLLVHAADAQAAIATALAQIAALEALA